MQRLVAKSLLLISLCILGTPGYAQKSVNVKRKLAIAPASVPLSPPAVQPLTRRTRVPTVQPGKLKTAQPGKAKTAQPGRLNTVESSTLQTAQPRKAKMAQPGKLKTAQLSKLKKLADSSYPQSHLQKGFYFKQQGRTNEALVEFIRASEENPRNVRAFYEQAQLFKLTGNIKLAKSSLEQALAVSPGNTQARSLLVQLHFESGNLIGAAAEVGKMLTLNQAPPAKNVDTDSSSLSAPPASARIANLSSAGVNTANSNDTDETLAWLHQAASPSETTKVSQANPGLNDVLAHIGSGADGARQNSGFLPQARLSEDDHMKAQGLHPAPVQAANGSSGAGSTKPANPAHSNSADPGLPAQSGLFSRVRSSATRAMTGLAKPVPAWVKHHLPLAGDKDGAAIGSDTKQSRARAAVSWVKGKVPFAANKPKACSRFVIRQAAQVSDWPPGSGLNLLPRSLTPASKQGWKLLKLPENLRFFKTWNRIQRWP